jgi:cytochrome c556
MKRVLIGAALLASFAAGAVHAQALPPDRAVKYRENALTVMSVSFGRIGAHVKGDAKLDQATLVANAELVEMLSKFAFDGFLKDTEQPTTTGKGAKPEIWKEWDKFKKDQADFQAAAGKLVEATKGGDAAAIQAAFGATGKTCKACHDAYRAQ